MGALFFLWAHVIAAIMSWNIFPFNLVQESFFFQLLGHIIISISLLYYAVVSKPIVEVEGVSPSFIF